MALYAFDGTGKKDESPEEELEDTNVARFFCACDDPQQRNRYFPGVGTKLGPLCRGVGKAFGVGARLREKDAYAELCQNVQHDAVIDIIGFSRGAAIALDFANLIYEKGALEGERPGTRRIRFLGLWDVVGSFGLSRDILGVPFQQINIGHKLDVPPNVDHCFHAMALDERRSHFVVTRLNENGTKPNVREVWFRGVHSDVGGGNQNTGLSNISLKWMLTKARACRLPVRDNTIEGLEMNPAEDLKEPRDKKMDAKRRIYPNDIRHHSVVMRAGNERYNDPPQSLKVEGPE